MIYAACGTSPGGGDFCQYRNETEIAVVFRGKICYDSTASGLRESLWLLPRIPSLKAEKKAVLCLRTAEI